MPVVISPANSKGGVAKTTTTVNLGHELAMKGKTVLIVDCDSQRSATNILGIETKPGQPTIYALLTEPEEGIARAVVTYTGTAAYPISYPNGGRLDIIPGAKKITEAPADFDKTRDRQPMPTFNHVLPYIIKRFCGGYEYVLIDSSPSQDRVNLAVIYATDWLIAPVAAEPMAIDGVQEMLETLKETNSSRYGLRLDGQTKLTGLLISKVLPDQMELVTMLQRVLDRDHIPHFGSIIVPYTSPGWQSTGERVPIAIYRHDDPAAAAYRQIAEFF